MCLKIGAVDLLQMSTSAICQGKIVYVSVNVSGTITRSVKELQSRRSFWVERGYHRWLAVRVNIGKENPLAWITSCCTSPGLAGWFVGIYKSDYNN
jgi:hypothetical protein